METVEFLKKKISPLENPEFTEEVKLHMRNIEKYRRKFRGTEHYVLDLVELYHDLFGAAPHNRQLTALGRSLQALYWERSALNGRTVFVKEVTEYEQFGY